MKNGTHKADTLDTYDELLRKRFALEAQQERIAGELRTVEEQLQSTRRSLQLALSDIPLLPPAGGTTEMEVSVPTVRRKQARPLPGAMKHANESTNGATMRFNYKTKLHAADPRIQRSLGEVFRTLEKVQTRRIGTSALAKYLKISKEAARLRLVRGVELGVFKKIGNAEYEATI